MASATQFLGQTFFNSSGIVLTWGNSGTRRLLNSTGVYGFSMHFGPISGRLQTRAAVFGAGTQWTAFCDYGLSINAGDIVVITNKKGDTLSTLEFYQVKGADVYPSLYLPHQVLFLEKYVQG